MTGNIIFEMIRINGNNTRRINHALKVYGIAKCIAEKEGVDEDTVLIIESAAVLHDIAIKFCETTYGSNSGHLQEKEGHVIARPILERYFKNEKFIERVLYIIGHHHTYENIEGIDYQIIVEADLLVNAEEGDITKTALKNAAEKLFKTRSAKDIAYMMFNMK